ncbi:hypothetical protein [Staphylococcus phage vB_ScaM-V1SC04]|nr:hypothetical protein [Staphylococcus phage vB_ScaM-V1SC04]
MYSIVILFIYYTIVNYSILPINYDNVPLTYCYYIIILSNGILIYYVTQI